jgi:hypothetical protein
LREVCAKGDIRSIHYKIEGWGEDGGEIVSEHEVKIGTETHSFADQPEFIRPSAWRNGEPDLIVDWNEIVRVSADDLRSWLKPTEAKKQEPKKKALGKRPRIKAHLAKLFPEGVPDPAHCPRKELLRELLKLDPGLKPLDDGTLKTAIEEYNTDPK